MLSVLDAPDEPPASENQTPPPAHVPLPAELLAQLVPGAVIDEKYTISSIIGRGGMGVVAAARHHDLGCDVALKFLCYGDGTGATDDLRARFRREAQINAKLRNEHITRVLDVGTWRNSAYMVLELLDGTDLRHRLKASGGKLPVAVALNYTLQLCEGMAEAHAHGIVHRDLKPANVFVARHTDGTDLIKIMDFGISKWRDSEIGEITKDGTVLGSPKYMAPEQIFGARSIDVRADVWSIGAILYQMLSGRTPYREPTLARLCAELIAGPPVPLQEVNPEVPERLAQVVANTLVRDPKDRTQSVAELAGALLESIDSPGDTLREKLSAIIAMRPMEESSGVRSGVRVSLASTTSISESLNRLSAATTTRASRVEEPPATAPAEVVPAVTVVPPRRAGSVAAYIGGTILVSTLVGVSVSVLRGGHPAAPVVIATTTVPEINAVAAPTSVPAEKTALAPSTAAPATTTTPSASASASTPRAIAAPTPIAPQRPRQPVAVTPKPGDTDIPSMR
jgi:serine/threonine-protein kinase